MNNSEFNWEKFAQENAELLAKMNAKFDRSFKYESQSAYEKGEKERENVWRGWGRRDQWESDFKKAEEFVKTGQPSEPAHEGWKCGIEEMVAVNAIHWPSIPYIPLAKLQAPKGWDNYLLSGNFKGCRPIIKPGAEVNYRCPAFETINFEMV